MISDSKRNLKVSKQSFENFQAKLETYLNFRRKFK